VGQAVRAFLPAPAGRRIPLAVRRPGFIAALWDSLDRRWLQPSPSSVVDVHVSALVRPVKRV
jgi:hypothetical protein